MATRADQSRLAEHLKRELAEATRAGHEPASLLRGISFSEELVRAILSGRKTVTRRPVRDDGDTCRYARAGEVLFLRQKWGRRSDGTLVRATDEDLAERVRWRAGRFMPRDAARTQLRVRSVTSEPLSRLSREDAIAEGAPPDAPDPVEWFRQAWDSFYADTDASWRHAPNVWVIAFEVLRDA